MEKEFKYKSISEFRKENLSEYNFLLRNNLLEKFCNDLGWEFYISKSTKPSGYWTKEHCIEEAKKYKTMTEWGKKNPTSYKISRKNGWFEECTPHMKRLIKPSGYWDNKERCIEESKKYTTKEEWKKNNKTSYNSAMRNGWFEECVVHMIKNRKSPNYWNKERCIEDAKKYTRKFEWQKNSPSAYGSAWKNNWLEECVIHMEKNKN